MKLLENIGCEKGITLNSQLVDLLSIIDNKNLTEEQQNDAIVNYINNLKVIQEKYEKANSNGVYAKYKFFIQNAISSIKIYLSNAKDLIVCNRDKMIQILQKEGFDESIHTKIMSDLKSKDYNAKEGILYLTPEKVRTLYSHMFENGNRYDRVTFDNAGKYSGYVAPDGETYSTEKIEKMQKFCENHGMKSKINALMFYDDFPKTLEQCKEIVSFFANSTDTTECVRAIKADERIIGCIAAFFKAEKDPKIAELAYWLSKEYRGQGIAGKLLDMAVDSLRSHGISPAYLLTDHEGFYERYGWEFLCMVQGDGEDHLSRMYIHY